MDISVIIAQLVVAAIGAFLGAAIALNRFKKEKWWEKKAEAYSGLIEALHNMDWPCSEHLEAALEQREVPPRDSEQLWDSFRKARKDVWKIASSSAFLISPDVIEQVKKMELGLHNSRSADDWVLHLDTQLSAIYDCLEKVKEIGRRELGVKDSNLTQRLFLLTVRIRNWFKKIR